MSTLGYVILAVVLPVAWGLGSAWAFDRVRARRAAARSNGKSDAELVE